PPNVDSDFRWSLAYLLPPLLHIHYGLSRVKQVRLQRHAVGGALLVAPSALCGSPVLAQGKTGLPVLPSAMDAMQSLSVHTAAVTGGFWLPLLTSPAKYVRGLIPRRAMRASCESPWRVSAKHRISGACFPLTTPFRTCFSPCEMARTAHVQKLIGCLYTLRDYSILTCRFHGTGHLSAKHCVLNTCLPRTAPFRSMLLTLRGGPQC